MTNKTNPTTTPSLDGLPQPVIEYVMGLVAENVALHKFCKDASFNADYEAELGMECGGFSDALEDIKTPSTDAAIDEIKAQGVDELSKLCFISYNHQHPATEEFLGFCKQFAANLRAGRKG